MKQTHTLPYKLSVQDKKYIISLTIFMLLEPR